MNALYVLFVGSFFPVGDAHRCHAFGTPYRPPASRCSPCTGHPPTPAPPCTQSIRRCGRLLSPAAETKMREKQTNSSLYIRTVYTVSIVYTGVIYNPEYHMYFIVCRLLSLSIYIYMSRGKKSTGKVNRERPSKRNCYGASRTNALKKK